MWLSGLGRRRKMEECPLWPPDLFAIAGGLLKRSGAYLRVFEHDGRSDYLSDVREHGTAWLKELDALSQPVTLGRLSAARPKAVEEAWLFLMKARETPINRIRKQRRLAEQLIRMALIADEASAGIGVEWDRRIDDNGARRSEPSTFLSLTDWMLRFRHTRSFCWEVSDDVVCVLGKQHTPQRGATFRSLSHHLSLYFPADIEARWVGPLRQPARVEEEQRMLNLLLLPWPTRIGTDDFRELRGSKSDGARSELAGYFRFDPKTSMKAPQFAQALRGAMRRAREHAGHIDAIVLPEVALNYAQYKVAERLAVEQRTMLICGVRKPSKVRRHDYNHCIFQPAGSLRDTRGESRRKKALVEELRLVQAKQHRWYLDREQIVSYQLGGHLPVARGSWENIELPERLLYFVTLNRMTWSVLICEDLARQDPAADLIRAVGPNLLIALLMDGPQLSGRWPARYASVLAEDPGCSVLTLTSLGMAQRCRPILRATGKRAESSRVVALWRDAQSGEIEIALDAGDDACVLSLDCTVREEFSADGRGDGSETRYPVFAGFRSFQAGSSRTEG
jgi:hypothetical protein